MIGKTITGNNMRGCLKYVFDDKNGSRDSEGNPVHRGEIVGGNMAGLNIEELSREFAAASSLKPSISKPVAHHILTFSPEDERKIDMRQMVKIADEYMNLRGYENSMYVTVAHRDTDNTHLHIVASKIDLDGKVVSEWRSKKKDFALCRELEKKHGLRELSDKPRSNRIKSNRSEIGYTERTGKETVKEFIQKAIDEVIVEKSFPSASPDEFIKRVQSQGISVKTRFDKQGKISGLSFAKESPEGKLIAFKGADLGRDYVWSNLEEKINYTQSKDFQPSPEATSEFKQTERDNDAIFQDLPKNKDKQIAENVLQQMRESLSKQSIEFSKEVWNSFEHDLIENFSQQKPSENQLKLIEKWETANSQERSHLNELTRLEAIQKLLELADDQQRDTIAKNTMDHYERQVREFMLREQMEKTNNEKYHSFDR